MLPPPPLPPARPSESLPPPPPPVAVSRKLLDAPFELEAPPAPQVGLVDFRVRPYASVFVNGTFYGVTPFEKVKLTVGTHTV